MALDTPAAFVGATSGHAAQPQHAVSGCLLAREVRAEMAAHLDSTAGKFLREFSLVLTTALGDDPAADWVGAMPPAHTAAAFERQLRLVVALMDVIAARATLDPFRICHVRSKPLFDCLAAVSTEDLSELLNLAEYLLLPKCLTLAVQQHQEALSQLGVPQVSAAEDPAGAARVHLCDVLAASALLTPLLEAASTAARNMLAPLLRPPEVADPFPYASQIACGVAWSAQQRQFFLRGLCGSTVARQPQPDMSADVADLALAKTRADLALVAEAAQVTGLLLAGHSPAWRAALSDRVRTQEAPVIAMAAAGRLESVRWLHSEGWSLGTGQPAFEAACNGHLHVLEFLLSVLPAPQLQFHKPAASGAALARQGPVLRWLAARGYSLHPATETAAELGDLGLVRWLVEEQRVPPDSGWTFALAASNAHHAVLCYLRDHGWTCGKHACASAAGGGHIAVLEWLRAQNPPCPWDAKEYTLAARNGHVDVLRWLDAQQPPVPWKANACAAAAKRGHLDALHWLRSQEPPCPWSGDEMSVAVRAGHVHVMEYLHDRGYAVNENTCRSALLGLQLGALKWLRSRDSRARGASWRSGLGCSVWVWQQRGAAAMSMRRPSCLRG